MFDREMSENEKELQKHLAEWAQEAVTLSVAADTAFIQFPVEYAPLLEELLDFAVNDAISSRPGTDLGRDLRTAMRVLDGESYSDEQKAQAQGVAVQLTRFIFGVRLLTLHLETTALEAVKSALGRATDVPFEVRERALSNGERATRHAERKRSEFLAGIPHECDGHDD